MNWSRWPLLRVSQVCPCCLFTAVGAIFIPVIYGIGASLLGFVLYKVFKG